MLGRCCISVLLVVTFSSLLHADTFDITQVNVLIAPNLLGDNVSVTMSGPNNALIATYGGIPCWSWCTDPQTGTGAFTDVGSISFSGFFSTVQGGGTDYLALNGGSSPFSVLGLGISGTQVTFPDNHQAFTSCSSASVNGAFSGFTGTGNTLTYNFLPTQGTLCTSWSYFDGAGWFFSSGTFDATAASPVPEPSSFYFLGSGLFGLVGLRARWRSRSR